MTYEINLLQIINGSLQTPVNITSYVSNGFSIVEKLDESLDIGSMVLRGLTTNTPYGMFDIIQIKIDSTEIATYRIGGDNVTLISKNPLRYEHVLSLVEHTKVLELYQISGKTFTQPTDGSTLKTLRDNISDLRLTTPLETQTNTVTSRIFLLPTSGASYDALNDTDSPEFTFKDVTFREALNDICGVVDAIPRLVFNSTTGAMTLQLDFVNDLQDTIDSFDGFVGLSKTQDIELYATQIESEALNVVSDKYDFEGSEIYPADGGYVALRSDDYIFDITKSYIPTPKPIYQIDKVVVLVEGNVYRSDTNEYFYGSSGTDEIFEIDITDRVYEYQTYKTLDSAYSVLDSLAPAKNNTIFYEYRKNNIQTGETYGLFDTGISLENVVEFSILDKLIEDGEITSGQIGIIVTTLTATYTDAEILFKVTYTPLPKSLRLNFDREDIDDIDKTSTILQNQQARLINIQNFSDNLYGKINRIGNSELSLDQRVLSTSDLYSIGSYTSEGYIVTERELIFYKDFIFAKYGLTRNYNMISKFIGVNSEVRQWEIGEQNTLDRNLIYKEYVEIDVATSGNGSSDIDVLSSDGIDTFLETFDTTSTMSQVNGGIITSGSFSDDIIVPTSSNGGGNSLIFNWKLPTNRSAGNYLETVASQTANNFVPYTDSYGELTTLRFYMFDELTTGATTMAQYLSLGFEYPITDVSYITTTLADETFTVYKDAREILGFTYQLQMISMSPETIILGKALSYRNRLVTDLPPTSFKLYVYDGFTFGRLDSGKAPSGGTELTSPTVTVNTTNMNVTVSHAGLDGNDDSWCLTDENDNILFAVNQSGTLLDTITFDFVNKRTDVNYEY